MPRDGKPTRNKILDHSKDLVLERGFSGVSIDMIIERSGISKGTFLYHFKTKNDLAKALLDEYIAFDQQERENALKHVGSISDPLKKLVAFTQVFIDQYKDLKEPYSGCLYASYSYEPELFPKEVLERIKVALNEWELTVNEMLEQIYVEYKPTIKVSRGGLANHFSTVFEGAFVVSKATNNAGLVAEQLKQYQNYIKLLFAKR